MVNNKMKKKKETVNKKHKEEFAKELNPINAPIYHESADLEQRAYTEDTVIPNTPVGDDESWDFPSSGEVIADKKDIAEKLRRKSLE